IELFSYIDLLNYMLKYKIPQIVTLIRYQDKRKKLLTTLLRQKAVSRNRQGGNGFFVVSVLTIIRHMKL
ncbi:hypothetical protein, partial [Bacteroides stercoris]|uniref:hypothetical protein n=1 Tax=Bacteroides stercoris TaxID=46506 RepID=UPI00359C2855